MTNAEQAMILAKTGSGQIQASTSVTNKKKAIVKATIPVPAVIRSVNLTCCVAWRICLLTYCSTWLLLVFAVFDFAVLAMAACRPNGFLVARLASTSRPPAIRCLDYRQLFGQPSFLELREKLSNQDFIMKKGQICRSFKMGDGPDRGNSPLITRSFDRYALKIA